LDVSAGTFSIDATLQSVPRHQTPLGWYQIPSQVQFENCQNLYSERIGNCQYLFCGIGRRFFLDSKVTAQILGISLGLFTMLKKEIPEQLQPSVSCLIALISR
jgi:hypothetical protein